MSRLSREDLIKKTRPSSFCYLRAKSLSTTGWYFGDCVYEGKALESSNLTKTKRPLFLLMTSCINDLETRVEEISEEIDPDTVCMSSGVVDSKRADTYTQDIILWEDSDNSGLRLEVVGVVEFYNGMFCVWSRMRERYVSLDEIRESKFQILGNVFDADESLLSKILIWQ